jgi:replication initiation and membrane attachment protein DnaB
MIHKQLIYPARVRRLPSQFSWIDQRLVRHHYLELCDHPTLALYLFLVTVADARGLSYYSDHSVCQRLDMEAPALARARDWLVHLQLIAYQAPLYQVLALEGEDD